MNNNGKLTARQEKFVHLVLEGEALFSAYRKSFKTAEGKSLHELYKKSSNIFNDPKDHARYLELRESMEKELQERAVWTKAQAIEELKELLRKNRIESDRYEQAYDDEMGLLDRKIEEKEKELNTPKGYLSRKKKQGLVEEIDKLKMDRIACNRRHQSNRNVNEAILQSIQQLNEMMGYNRKPDEKVNLQAQVTFVDDVPEDDEGES